MRFSLGISRQGPLLISLCLALLSIALLAVFEVQTWWTQVPVVFLYTAYALDIWGITLALQAGGLRKEISQVLRPLSRRSSRHSDIVDTVMDKIQGTRFDVSVFIVFFIHLICILLILKFGEKINAFPMYLVTISIFGSVAISYIPMFICIHRESVQREVGGI